MTFLNKQLYVRHTLRILTFSDQLDFVADDYTVVSVSYASVKSFVFFLQMTDRCRLIAF